MSTTRTITTFSDEFLVALVLLLASAALVVSGKAEIEAKRCVVEDTLVEVVALKGDESAHVVCSNSRATRAHKHVVDVDLDEASERRPVALV